MVKLFEEHYFKISGVRGIVGCIATHNALTCVSQN
jgi:hypothetical protein